MQNALLTGAHGFLGNYILRHLSNRYKVDTLGMAAASTYRVDISHSVPLIDKKYELVVHAAGLAHTKQKSLAEKFFAVNADGSQRICDAFDRLNEYPKHFVLISTVAVYGPLAGELITEDYPLAGVSPYAKSKILAEEIVATWCEMHQVSCTILRLPLVLGKNAPGNYGAMVRSIKKNRFFIPGKGDAKKSMVLADDVALLIAGTALTNGVFNVTDGYHPALSELSEIIAKKLKKRYPVHLPLFLTKMLAYTGDLLGEKFPFNSAVLKQLNTPLTFCDKRARAVLGWNPRVVIENLEL
jgi:nucleoside-diphosphate-sugar epimerase